VFVFPRGGAMAPAVFAQRDGRAGPVHCTRAVWRTPTFAAAERYTQLRWKEH
jgi:hypothetical protein